MAVVRIQPPLQWRGSSEGAAFGPFTIFNWLESDLEEKFPAPVESFAPRQHVISTGVAHDAASSPRHLPEAPEFRAVAVPVLRQLRDSAGVLPG